MGSINLYNPPYKVLYSTDSSSFSTLKNIVSIPISTCCVDYFVDKPPWKTIVIASECEVKNGVYTKNNNEIIEIKADSWDWNIIEELTSNEVTLCIVSIDIQGTIFSSICLGCSIVGIRYNCDDIYISFETSKVEELSNEHTVQDFGRSPTAILNADGSKRTH